MRVKMGASCRYLTKVSNLAERNENSHDHNDIGDFCQKCAVQKLGILRQWPITKDELQQLAKWGVKVVKICDDC